jgi:hypothetical protein
LTVLRASTTLPREMHAMPFRAARAPTLPSRCAAVLSLVAFGVACDPPPPRDVTTQACIARDACFGDTDRGVVASEAGGLTFEVSSRTTPLTPERTSRVTFRVRVVGGAGRAPRVVLDFESRTDAFLPEPQEIHCGGEATREPSPRGDDAERLVLADPDCTRWEDSSGQCPYVVERIVIEVARDGTIRVEPFDAHYRNGATCSGWGSTGIRIGAEHLVVTEPPS